MQPKRFQPESRLAGVDQQVTHPRDQMSTERVIGIVLWTVLIVVLITFGVY